MPIPLLFKKKEKAFPVIARIYYLALPPPLLQIYREDGV